MSASIRLLRRYVWLVETVRRAGSISLEEINRKWSRNTSLNIDGEEAIPERTFHRHREAIADLFDIDIRCNRYDGHRYYIANEEQLDRPSFSTRLFNGLAISNQMLGNREVYERILFEDASGGEEYLPLIIEAIAENKVLSLTYRRFNSADTSNHIVTPALLKQSQRRWYLVGRINGREHPTVFALDRILRLELTDETFAYDGIEEIKRMFQETVGVNVDDELDCEDVVVRVYGRQRPYFESLPLHPSQTIKAKATDHTDYSFRLRPEYEFQHAILRLGPDAEVLSPQWLRDELAWLAAETLRRYSSPQPKEQPHLPS